MVQQFRFGENWKSFLSTVTPASIAEAEAGLSRLFSGDALRGQAFFDIGCGSGLSMLAAYRLGSTRVDGIDVDAQSVEATRTLLSAHVPTDCWSVRQVSILELADHQKRGVVHSWGVLHHTGAMWPAMKRAADLVADGGLFAVALYRRTPLCALWGIEKRIYSRAPGFVQKLIRAVYKTVYVAGLAATRRNPARYIAAYKSSRGMDWHHDVHDWLGGYPYKSATPHEVAGFLQNEGFVIERIFEKPAAVGGLFGSHCDEFVARRISPVRAGR